MNFIFTVILTVSVLLMAFISPESVVSSMTDGAAKGVTLSITLIAVYAVWSGVMEMAEKSGITNKLAKFLSPIIDRLFSRPEKETKKQISLNLSANLFGLGGIATPAGISAAELLDKKGDREGLNVLFILAATSIQILPATVIAMRQRYGSTTPSDIFLPTLLSTAVSTATGLFLLKLTKKRSKKL